MFFHKKKKEARFFVLPVERKPSHIFGFLLIDDDDLPRQGLGTVADTNAGQRRLR